MQETTAYKPKNHIRVVTATSLFDGHDASINIMRRILQASGAEIIHLGHNISVKEIVDCAIQENVQSIAVTSYQGGHIEFFKYMYDLLKERGCCHIRIFGGGGGVILPHEIDDLHAYGITRIYSPDDGRAMGLQGMINDLLEKSDFAVEKEMSFTVDEIRKGDHHAIAWMTTMAENSPGSVKSLLTEIEQLAGQRQTPGSWALPVPAGQENQALPMKSSGGFYQISLIKNWESFVLTHPNGKRAVRCWETGSG